MDDTSKILTVNDLKKYLNSRSWDDDVIVCIFDVNDGVRYDVFNSLDFIDDLQILDINIEI